MGVAQKFIVGFAQIPPVALEASWGGFSSHPQTTLAVVPDRKRKCGLYFKP